MDWIEITTQGLTSQSNPSIVLKDLSFKTVMMAFYQKQLKQRVIPQLDQEKVMYVGIQSAEHTAISDHQEAILVFSPAAIYNNLKQLKTTTTLSFNHYRDRGGY